MSSSLALLLIVNFCLIGALPRIFFRRGSFNPAWWANALPLAASALGVILVALRLQAPAFAIEPLEPVATLAAATSIALISATLGTHSRPLSLWHQPDDTPTHLVTSGPYRSIRHPFYAAFLLTLLAAVIAAPHALTLAGVVYGGFRLNLTAEGEERRFLGSEFREEYATYMTTTGRFLPRGRRGRSHRSVRLAPRR